MKQARILITNSVKLVCKFSEFTAKLSKNNETGKDIDNKFSEIGL